MSISDDAKREMEQAVEHLSGELRTLRTGRASPGLLEGVHVEVYGSDMRLIDVASITAPEARQLLVSPYEANNANAIAKAIDKANLSVKVVVDGNIVRVTVPLPDEQMRKELVKRCYKFCEDTKVTIRNIRRKHNDHARKKKADGDIAEDELKRIEKKIQTLTDESCAKADEVAAKKEKEILVI